MSTLHLIPELASPAKARHAVGRELASRYPPEVVEVVRLLVTELVTNAVLHAQTEVCVNLEVLNRGIRVEVGDGSAELPVPRLPTEVDELEPSGRGLILVQRLADSWGVQRRGRGKVVWFELEAAAPTV